MPNIRSSSLFTRLYQLVHGRVETERECQEDYLTELMAYALGLGNNAQRFFRMLNIQTHTPRFTITTQFSRAALDSHEQASRVDLVLEGEDTIIFIENKIEAHEGHKQLARYTDHLLESGKRLKVLLYITKAYDPKPNSHPNIQFRSIRWYKAYTFFKSQQNNVRDPFYNQFLRYLEDRHMNQSRMLSKKHTETLPAMGEAQQILLQAYSGQVKELLTQLGVDAKTPSDKSMNRNHPDCPFWFSAKNRNVSFGVYVQAGVQTPKPLVCVCAETWADDQTKFKDKAQAFARRHGSHGWEFRKWEDSNGCGIYCEKKLTSVLGLRCPDHVSAIETFWVAELKRLVALRLK